jgi:hypothetical protein
MDCYLIGDDTLAEMHARELLRKTTNPDGSSGLPIAAPRACLTLDIVAASVETPNSRSAAATRRWRSACDPSHRSCWVGSRSRPFGVGCSVHSRDVF